MGVVGEGIRGLGTKAQLWGWRTSAQLCVLKGFGVGALGLNCGVAGVRG